ncbi:UDP-N-acetylmuramoyl-tripeptide--D-alanyl-D-alanine ligase [Salimicrobium flavidum]|uniref:UDP-N-acetylmuramoyl-tripeptide--D-alanyl-D-alanine ligase n=1 Tax=Salimicrobium flavidum TaxID=570947 RepID=A0A1N7ILJ2_9BACI|nr:UDP-N-acetylmuramoyl-tripeptide--D-alanyl-D-alanine ligase [Salimicrobium flavidum]SIS37934.1 UDP-N-acetylmuramoyl-tripeptide--D-alanyl-D-alanine ligase [Salimicrobium flavidum]
MIITTGQLTSLFEEGKGGTDKNIRIESVMTDTRIEQKGSLFIPIVGENFDAHSFLDKAIENGAVAALWQKNMEFPADIHEDFPVFFVEDTVSAMQLLANEYIRRIQPTVVAVTGSNGKTTTKDMAASVLSQKFRTHHTKGNLNNHIGVPLTIFSMPEDTQVLVLEMGMNNKGEIEVLSNIARPHYGIVTNIGESHIEQLGSRENIAAAKLEITSGFRDDGELIFDGDEKLLKGTDGLSCGFSENVEYRAKEIFLHDEGSRFLVEGHRYLLPLVGKHNVKNATYVILLAKKLGMDAAEIQKGFDSLSMTGMRLEKLNGMKGSHVFNDTYNASPTSMKAVIEFVRTYKTKSHKVLVLGDMYELGMHSKELHAQVAEAITPEIDIVMTVGDDSKAISDKVATIFSSITTKHFREKGPLIEELKSVVGEQSIVLVKASRGMKLEEIVDTIVKD